jgi:DNA polymerase-3 subunit beta
VKLHCERDVILEALASAGRAVSRQSAMPPVLRIHLEGDSLVVSGTDQELTISAIATVNGTSGGTVVAPAQLVTEVVRAFDPGAVTMELSDDEHELHVSSGRSSFVLRTYDVEEFPRLPAPVGEEVRVESSGFAEALRQVTRAASKQEERGILTGVLMEARGDGLRLVATDSYRLAMRDLPGVGVLASGERVVVPSRSLAELARLLSRYPGDLVLRLSAQAATFVVGPVTLSTRLILGQFPDYEKLIPQNLPGTLVVGREALIDALRRVRVLVPSDRRDNTPVRIPLQAERLEVSVTTADLGSAVEEVDAKYDGPEMLIAFNPDLLADGLDAVGSEEVHLAVENPHRPAVLSGSEADHYTYLLMPMRV